MTADYTSPLLPNTIPAIALHLLGEHSLLDPEKVISFFQEHPLGGAFPSLQQLFAECQIEHLRLEVSSEHLSELRFPLVTSIFWEEQQAYIVVESVTSTEVRVFWDNEVQSLPYDQFLTLWQEQPVLLYDMEASQIPVLLQKSPKTLSLTHLLGSAILLIYGFVLVAKMPTLEFPIWRWLSFGTLTVAGLYSTILIHLKTAGQSSPLLNRFCTTDRVDGCDFILHSRFAHILPGLSWTSLGFTFFATVLFFLLIDPLVDFSALSILQFLYLLTIPMILLSLFIQSFLSDYWCKLCLIVQGILIASILVLVGGVPIIGEISMYSFLYFSLAFPLGVLSWQIFRFVVATQLDLVGYQRLLRQTKLDPLTIQGHFGSTGSSAMPLQLPASPLPTTSELDPDLIPLLFITNPSCEKCGQQYETLQRLADHYADQISVHIAFHIYEHESHLNTFIQHLASLPPDQLLPTLIQWHQFSKKETPAVFLNQIQKKYPELSPREQALPITKAPLTQLPTIYLGAQALPQFYDLEDIPYLLPWVKQFTTADQLG